LSAGRPSASTIRSRPATCVAKVPPARRTTGITILPVMSPPMSRTSAPSKGPAFKNLRKQRSEPWMSVAQNSV